MTRGAQEALVSKCLPLAQVMIPGSWDPAPHHRALCSVGALLLPLHHLCSLSLWLAQIKKKGGGVPDDWKMIEYKESFWVPDGFCLNNTSLHFLKAQGNTIYPVIVTLNPNTLLKYWTSFMDWFPGDF